MAPKKYNPVLENKAVSSILLHAEPLWDSSPIKLPGWYTLLLKDITNENAAYDTLLKYGFIATSRGVACASAGQAAALEDSSYGPYTYQNPSPIDPSTETSVMAKVAAGCTFHADKADATAVPSAAGALLSLAMPAAPHVIARRYKEAPEEVTAVDLELQQFMLRRIGNQTVRDSFATRSCGSGRTLLRLLSQKKDSCLGEWGNRTRGSMWSSGRDDESS